MTNWFCEFSKDGVLRSLGRVEHIGRLAGPPPEKIQARHRAEVFDEARSDQFSPGRTIQHDVLDAWGVCDSGEVTNSGFWVHWLFAHAEWARGDDWRLDFSKDGVLVSKSCGLDSDQHMPDTSGK